MFIDSIETLSATQRILRLSNARKTYPENPTLLNQLAIAYKNKRQYKHAIEFAKRDKNLSSSQAKALRKKSVKARLRSRRRANKFSQSYTHQNVPGKSKEHKMSLALKVEEKIANETLALSYLALKNPKEAMRFARPNYSTAMKDKLRGNTDHIVTWLDVLYHSGKQEEALQTARKFVQTFPGITGSYQALAKEYLRSAEDYEKAIEAAQQAISLSPESPVGYFYLAQGYFGDSQMEMALVAIRTAIELSNDDDGRQINFEILKKILAALNTRTSIPDIDLNDTIPWNKLLRKARELQPDPHPYQKPSQSL